MRFICLLIVALISGCLTASLALAVDGVVHAGIQTRAVISLAKAQDMDFGILQYEAAHVGAVQLGTDGSVQLSGGSSGLSLGGGNIAAGQLSVSGDGQSTVEVSCEQSGVLRAPSADTLSLDNVEFSIGAGTAYGAGTPCQGLSSAAGTVDLSVNPAPEILFGGMVSVNANAISDSETYSTANAGGNPVTVRVVYQ